MSLGSISVHLFMFENV